MLNLPRFKYLIVSVGTVVAVLLVRAGGLETAFARGQPAVRPDIVLVTIDALRADHVGAYGYPRLTTPAIDAFMRRHVRFANAIAQAPYTKASIASLMTGLYASAHGAVTTSVPFVETMTGHAKNPILTDVLSPSTPTLASLFRIAGYRTIGLTANPFLIEDFGFGQGFDAFQFYPGGDFATAQHLVSDGIETARTTPVTQPMFLWLHLMEPHSPYTPPPLTAGMFKPTGGPEPIRDPSGIPPWLLPGSPNDRRQYISAYDDEVAAADVAFDTLIREIHSIRLGRAAVVVLTADHGEQFLEHGGWEHSSNLYDELIKVPLGIQVPGVPARTVDEQVQLIDLFPTLLELADADVPSNSGRSLRPLFRGHADARIAVSEVVASQYAVRDRGFKLIESSAGREQLFNLSTDPAEQHDISATNPARVAAMRTDLHRVLARALGTGRTIHHDTAPIDPALAERLRALGYAK